MENRGGEDRCKPTPLLFDTASLCISPRKSCQAGGALLGSVHRAPGHAFAVSPSDRATLYFQRHGGEQEVGTQTCRSYCSRRKEGLTDNANKINAFDATSVVEEREKEAGDVAGQNAGLIDGIRVPRQQPRNSVPTVVMVFTSSSSYSSSSSPPHAQ